MVAAGEWALEFYGASCSADALVATVYTTLEQARLLARYLIALKFGHVRPILEALPF